MCHLTYCTNIFPKFFFFFNVCQHFIRFLHQIHTSDGIFFLIWIALFCHCLASMFLFFKSSFIFCFSSCSSSHPLSYSFFFFSTTRDHRFKDVYQGFSFPSQSLVYFWKETWKVLAFWLGRHCWSIYVIDTSQHCDFHCLLYWGRNWGLLWSLIVKGSCNCKAFC